MHLTHHHKTGRAEPAHWIVIDDFGTLHDALMNRGDFGGSRDSAHLQRWDFYWSNLQDPDFTRVKETAPILRQARKRVIFTGPLGAHLEGELIVEFTYHPAWDDVAFEPLMAKLQGARVEVLEAYINVGSWIVDVPEGAQTELEQLCWDYLHLKQAEEDAREAKRQKEWARRQAAEAEQ
jgi:hypothetical protein